MRKKLVAALLCGCRRLSRRHLLPDEYGVAIVQNELIALHLVGKAERLAVLKLQRQLASGSGVGAAETLRVVAHAADIALKHHDDRGRAVAGGPGAGEFRRSAAGGLLPSGLPSGLGTGLGAGLGLAVITEEGRILRFPGARHCLELIRYAGTEVPVGGGLLSHIRKPHGLLRFLVPGPGVGHLNAEGEQRDQKGKKPYPFVHMQYLRLKMTKTMLCKGLIRGAFRVLPYVPEGGTAPEKG